MIIRMDDITRAGYCAAGTRRWFANYGLDFRAFVKPAPDGGIDSETLLATGDALAQRVVALKTTREADNG